MFVQSGTASIMALAEIYRRTGLEPADKQPERPDYIEFDIITPLPSDSSSFPSKERRLYGRKPTM